MKSRHTAVPSQIMCGGELLIPGKSAIRHTQVDAEGIRDLLGDLAAAEVWVAPFHLDHRVDLLSGRTLKSGRRHRLEL